MKDLVVLCPLRGRKSHDYYPSQESPLPTLVVEISTGPLVLEMEEEP